MLVADAGRLRADVSALAVPRNRRWHPDAMAAAQRHVAAELTAAGWLVERRPFTARWRLASNDSADLRARLLRVRGYRGLSGVNLVARHPAAPPGPEVLVGAHLDTVRGSPGADDNASGVAALLEVARLLADRPAAVALAVFDLEELGLVGAAAVARSETGLRGMICLESVGYYSTAAHSQRLPAGAALAFPLPARRIVEHRSAGDFSLVVHRRTSTSAAWLWESAAAEVGHRAVLLRDPRRDGPAGVLSTALLPHTLHLGRSDHAAFWRRGVPALMVTDTASFRNQHYHRAGDTADTLDYERLAHVATATAVTAAGWPTVAPVRAVAPLP